MTEPKPLTPEELVALKKLDDQRTPGEWFDIPHPEWAGAYHRVALSADEPWGRFNPLAYASGTNAAFITACSTTVPRLLATIAAYRAALAYALNYGQCTCDLYPGEECRCGYGDSLKQAKELLGEEVQNAG